MLRISNLHKTYLKAVEPTLRGLSLEFPRPTIAGLLGPNGAGKTTTISILCGLVRPDSGTVEVLGADIRTDLERIKKRIGVVPQSIALYPPLSVRENLEYIGALYKIPGTILQQRIRHFLQLFGLDHTGSKAIRYFSGGMKRRANIIASLLHEPELLVLDEPTAGVDVQSRNLILQFLEDYHGQGHSIIYTSHLLEEAQQLCREVAIMDHGQLVVQGDPRLLMKDHGFSSLEQVFLHLTGISLRD
ncbi:ABC transporter ATP-binding protein [Flavihumibacter petaseus]|uniref:Putative ABC transporter ATP-binding protein n=1 Tax=Flavihumibacter petaseus NBRC 106054 TaxID=1220578 RepID=A0A0E9MUC6_9BACT|nr:ABC transporter ATP-binding protein [Flavihumibacter petaseus]GAO41174.1 putative ABC transporter ATP-binding protein [Flavihumibacter petaseus NBRC 106054]